jgi:SNF2 family DNA or RNA helicase
LIIEENSTKEKVIRFNPDNLKELSLLDNFPGTLNGICPFDPDVLNDLVARIKSSNIKVYTKDLRVKQLAGTRRDESLPPSFKFHTEPLPFQRRAVEWAAPRNNVGFLLSPGLGKTKVCLDWLHLKQPSKILVCCPSPLRDVWVEEATKHRPEFSPIIVTELAQLEELKDAKFLVCSYTIATMREEWFQQWVPEALILDEALIKNPDSQRTKSLSTLSKVGGVKYRALLSGTLINNHEGEVFAPVNFLEPSMFGKSHYLFKKKYFYFSPPDENGKSYPYGVKTDYREELRSSLRAVSIVMRKEQYLSSLPEKAFHLHWVEPSGPQLQRIEELCQFSTIDDIPVLSSNPLAILGKLIQLENNFYYKVQKGNEPILEELLWGETNKVSKVPRETIYLSPPEENPKMRTLAWLAQTLGAKRGIIWFNFNAELPQIKATLRDKYLVVDSKTKSASKVVKEFNENPEYRWLVAQARVLNYGFTILGEPSEDDILPEFDPHVSVEIFCSLNFSYEVFMQQQDRIHRIGQVHKCEYHLLLSKSRGDELIEEALRSKKNVQEFMLQSTA